MLGASVLCGAIAGLGLVLVVAGLRKAPRSSSRQNLDLALARQTHRLAVPAAIGITAAVVTLVFTGWPVFAVWVAVLATAAPGLLARNRTPKASIARIEGLAGWAEMIRDTTSAAQGVQGAIVRIGPIAPVAIRPYTIALASDMRLLSLRDALRKFADDIDDPMADLIAIAVMEASKSTADGSLGTILTALAANLRQHASMRMRIEVSRAKTRTATRSIVGLSAFMIAVFLVFDRDFLSPYNSATGQLALLVIGGCMAGSFWLLQRMGTSTTPPRVRMPDDWAART